MNVLTSDWEVTTSNKGNPFDVTNKAVCLGVKYGSNKSLCSREKSYWKATNLKDFLCVFFHAKFDLHWYRKEGITLPQRVWCCQVAEYMLSRQKYNIRLPPEERLTLENTAIKYGLGHKIDVIKTEYWDKGIDTDAIPPEILAEYCRQDVDLTYPIYLKQVEQFKERPNLYKLFLIQMQDLLVLQEMEWNGLLFDESLCQEKLLACQEQFQSINKELQQVYPALNINFGSPQQVSAFLFGGSIKRVETQQVGFYKNGNPHFKKVEVLHELPRLVNPGDETKTEGVFKTDEATLRKLQGKAAKKYVAPLLKLAELEKLIGTYYEGIPKINKTMNWPPGKLHGQYNQVVTQTSRLSSDKPNLQNLSSECLDIIVSEYD